MYSCQIRILHLTGIFRWGYQVSKVYHDVIYPAEAGSVQMQMLSLKLHLHGSLWHGMSVSDHYVKMVVNLHSTHY